MRAPAHRECAEKINAFHSVLYFGPDLDTELARHGVRDPMETYLAGRSAPLGAVGPGAVIATFNAFATPLVARHFPAVWEKVSPAEVIAARIRAADAVLRRLLGDDVVASPEMAEAAELVAGAARACLRAGRPLYSANADLDVPGEAHLALWHWATLLREYRGDGHVVALGHAELTGLEALVSHCASPAGMPKEVVMAKRGWTEADWSATQARLAERGLMTSTGELTVEGARLRERLEDETDRLDRLPYERLGGSGVARLAELTGGFVIRAANSEAFPSVLRNFFVPAA
jgi:helix-turn-helix protein